MPPRAATIGNKLKTPAAIRAILRGEDPSTSGTPTNNTTHTSSVPIPPRLCSGCADWFAPTPTSPSCSCVASIDNPSVLLGRLICALLIFLVIVPLRYFLVGDKSLPLEAAAPVACVIAAALFSTFPSRMPMKRLQQQQQQQQQQAQAQPMGSDNKSKNTSAVAAAAAEAERKMLPSSYEYDTVLEEELVPVLLEACRVPGGVSFTFVVDAAAIAVWSYCATLLQAPYYQQLLAWAVGLRNAMPSVAMPRRSGVSPARSPLVSSVTGQPLHYLPELLLGVILIGCVLQGTGLGRSLAMLFIPFYLIFHHLFGSVPHSLYPRETAWWVLTHVSIGITLAAQIRLAGIAPGVRSVWYTMLRNVKHYLFDAPIAVLERVPVLGHVFRFVIVSLLGDGLQPGPSRSIAATATFGLIAWVDHASLETVPILPGAFAMCAALKFGATFFDLCFTPAATQQQSGKEARAGGEGRTLFHNAKNQLLVALWRMGYFVVLALFAMLISVSAPPGTLPFLTFTVIAGFFVIHFAETDLPPRGRPPPSLPMPKPGNEEQQKQQREREEAMLVPMPCFFGPVMWWAAMVILEFDARYGISAAALPLVEGFFFETCWELLLSGDLVANTMRAARLFSGGTSTDGTSNDAITALMNITGSIPTMPPYSSPAVAQAAAKGFVQQRRNGTRILAAHPPVDFVAAGGTISPSHEVCCSMSLAWSALLIAQMMFGVARRETTASRMLEQSQQRLVEEEAEVEGLRARLREQQELWREKREGHIRSGGQAWVSPPSGGEDGAVDEHGGEEEEEEASSSSTGDDGGEQEQQEPLQDAKQPFSSSSFASATTARSSNRNDTNSPRHSESHFSENGSAGSNLPSPSSTSAATAAAAAKANHAPAPQQQQQQQQQLTEEQRAVAEERARQREEDRKKKREEQRQRDLAAKQERLMAEAALRKQIEAERRARAEAEQRERDEQRAAERRKEEGRLRDALVANELAGRQRTVGAEEEEREHLRSDVARSKQSAADRHRARLKKEKEREAVQLKKKQQEEAHALALKEAQVKRQQKQKEQQEQLQLQDQPKQPTPPPSVNAAVQQAKATTAAREAESVTKQELLQPQKQKQPEQQETTLPVPKSVAVKTSMGLEPSSSSSSSTKTAESDKQQATPAVPLPKTRASKKDAKQQQQRERKQGRVEGEGEQQEPIKKQTASETTSAEPKIALPKPRGSTTTPAAAASAAAAAAAAAADGASSTSTASAVGGKQQKRDASRGGESAASATLTTPPRVAQPEDTSPPTATTTTPAAFNMNESDLSRLLASIGNKNNNQADGAAGGGVVPGGLSNMSGAAEASSSGSQEPLVLLPLQQEKNGGGGGGGKLSQSPSSAGAFTVSSTNPARAISAGGDDDYEPDWNARLNDLVSTSEHPSTLAGGSSLLAGGVKSRGTPPAENRQPTLLFESGAVFDSNGGGGSTAPAATSAAAGGSAIVAPKSKNNGTPPHSSSSSVIASSVGPPPPPPLLSAPVDGLQQQQQQQQQVLAQQQQQQQPPMYYQQPNGQYVMVAPPQHQQPVYVQGADGRLYLAQQQPQHQQPVYYYATGAPAAAAASSQQPQYTVINGQLYASVGATSPSG